MGVPKFFRWMSERYPLILQRYGSQVQEETYHLHFPAKEDDVANKNDNDDTSDDDNKSDTAVASDNNVDANADTKDSHRPWHVLPKPDPLSTCGGPAIQPPRIDRLYIDMNGIIHGCAHSNMEEKKDDDKNISTIDDDNRDENEEENPDRMESTTTSGVKEEDILRNVCYYLDRLVRDVAQPQELLYLAIDGVAPRAKLNQQRARRYRSAKEGEIERTVYDAHLQALEKSKQQKQLAASSFADGTSTWEAVDNESSDNDGIGAGMEGDVKEVKPGRFTGKFELVEQNSNELSPEGIATGAADGGGNGEDVFHSNAITPGTPFFQRCTRHLEAFIRDKMATDPAWQRLNVIFSGPNCPGEGEHKIMQFMREQRALDNYDPNLRHCIMGQDGDLIMLSLATHEPNLLLLREKVLFDDRRRQNDALLAQFGLDVYMHNAEFEIMHMNVLRDYLALEFGTSNVMGNAKDSDGDDNHDDDEEEKPSFDLERTIDDFILLTFLIGNDFLPHMPALDIADEAFDLLFYNYRHQRERWYRQERAKGVNVDSPDFHPYLTYAGDIVSGQRLEDYLSVVGAHESKYYDFKKSNALDNDKARAMEAKFGHKHTPGDDILASKEASDRLRYRQMLLERHEEQKQTTQKSFVSGEDDFAPVMSASPKAAMRSVRRQSQLVAEDEDGEGIATRIGNILESSLSNSENEPKKRKGPGVKTLDEDLKGRYYADKFGFSPFEVEKHRALRKAYIEGLVWNLQYYFHKTVSWTWFYPYHYGPMISDLVGIDKVLEEVSFEGRLGEPLKPFEQLMACMPASNAYFLPEPYQKLMTDADSPISDFYPNSFVVDMNGKRWPWEAAVLLPFIDSQRLLSATNDVDTRALTDDELERNELKDAVVFSCDSSSDTTQDARVIATPFADSAWLHKGAPEGPAEEGPKFLPALKPGVVHPLEGLPTLRDGSVHSMWRRSTRVNVHGNPSRYQTAVLEMHNSMPEVVPIATLAKHLIGSCVYINYPHLVESFVTAVSDARVVIRGEGGQRSWSIREATERKARVKRIGNSYLKGSKLTGTGGLALSGNAHRDLEVLLHVRPVKGVKTLADGTVGKTFAKYEVEVPLLVTNWAPVRTAAELEKLPMLLERDPYHAAKRVLTNPKEVIQMETITSAESGSSSSSGKQLQKLLVGVNGDMAAGVLSSSKISGGSTVAFSRSFSSLSSMPTPRRFTTASLPSQCQLANAASRPPRSTGCPSFASRRAATGRPPRIAVGMVLAAAAASLFSPTNASYDPRPSVSQHTFGGLPHHQVSSPLPSAFVTQESVGHPSGLPQESRTPPPLEFAHGTTTLSFVFQGGVVAAVDSRASMGNFVSSKTTQKVLPVNSHILGTMAGGAADCSFWIRKLSGLAALHELKTLDQDDGDDEGSHCRKRMTVTRASRILSDFLYQNRGLGLSMGTMIMGFDDDNEANPPRIFYVDDSGMRLEGDLFACGSGSTYALGIIDTERRFDMTEEEAVALGIKAIRHATFRDAFSGGFINVYLITRRDGWKRVFREDVAATSTQALPVDCEADAVAAGSI